METKNFQMSIQAGFRKGRGIRDQIATIGWITEKAREFQENIYLVSSTTPKPLTVGIIINWGRLLKRWEYQAMLPVSWETCMRVKKQQLEPCMEQLTGSHTSSLFFKLPGTLLPQDWKMLFLLPCFSHARNRCLLEVISVNRPWMFYIKGNPYCFFLSLSCLIFLLCSWHQMTRSIFHLFIYWLPVSPIRMWVYRLY